MAALFQLLNFIESQKDRELQRQYTEVKMEAYRRSQNAAAVQEGKAMALRDNLNQTAKDIETADMDVQRTQKQWFEARQKGMLSAEQNQLYREAVANSQANLEMQKSKYRVLTMERGHMDGSLDKTMAQSSKPMFDRIFDPKKDPYDQIQEERRSKTVDETAGTETEIIQKGPASAFSSSNPYLPREMEEDKYQAPATPKNLLGFNPSGFEDDPEAMTAEYSFDTQRAVSPAYTPAQSQRSMVDISPAPTSTATSTEAQIDPAQVRAEAEEILKNPNIPPEKKQKVRERAAKFGIQL